MTQETYALTFKAKPGYTAPAITRLRTLLKFAGRVCGLKCVQLVQIKPEAPAEEAAK